MWAKDALLNVSLYEQYETRLKEKFEMDVDIVSVQNKKVLPQNCEKNISETMIKVSQKGNIILKQSVLTEQYANVSKRKNENKEN